MGNVHWLFCWLELLSQVFHGSLRDALFDQIQLLLGGIEELDIGFFDFRLSSLVPISHHFLKLIPDTNCGRVQLWVFNVVSPHVSNRVLGINAH